VHSSQVEPELANLEAWLVSLHSGSGLAGPTSSADSSLSRGCL